MAETNVGVYLVSYDHTLQLRSVPSLVYYITLKLYRFTVNICRLISIKLHVTNVLVVSIVYMRIKDDFVGYQISICM